MIGSAEELFASAVLKTDVVKVRGLEINVREMSDAARAEVSALVESDPLKTHAVAALHCAVNAKGQRLFGPNDLEKVRDSLPPDVLEAISDKVMALSGYGKGAEPPKA